MSEMRTACLLCLFYCFVLHACTKEEEIIPLFTLEQIIVKDSIQVDTILDCAIDTMLVHCTSANEDTIRIRMSNVSSFKLENVIANFVGDDVFYGSLDSSESSAYRCYAHAWSSAIVELSIACDTLTYQPIDFVGERILENGRYTFEVDVADEGDRYNRLQLKVVDEQ